MAIFPGSAIPSAVSDYEIEYSMRCDDGRLTYLSRTPGSAGNLRTWSLSFWKKRTVTTEEPILSAGNYTSGITTVYFATEGTLNINHFNGTSYTTSIITEPKYRDPSAWAHYLVVWDTTNATETDRVRVYKDGARVTDISSSGNTFPALNFDGIINSTAVTRVARDGTGGTYGRGLYAEMFFIDGTAFTDADDFGELDSDTNQWIPKDAKDDLTFGTNGFYQKYGSSGGHTSFLANGTYTVPAGITSVEYLVIGGGGGGGSRFAGGGGAGGYRTGTLSVTPGSDYSITVGAGGAGGVTSGSSGTGGAGIGTNGASSIFSTITSTGGGGGGAGDANDGADGASGGGGAGRFASSGGSSTSYGNDGGDANGSSLGGDNYRGGGGGGSGAVGNGGSVPGTGGAGTASSITGVSVTRAGGGGGGGGNSTSYGNAAGGSGGGGTGGYGIAGTAGTANTGSGGGGGGLDTDNFVGGAGGSGIVIIRPAATFGLGLDSSGNGNNFTETNLVATDQMIDTPTNNFVLWNPCGEEQARCLC